MCRVLQISRSGYYSWLKRPESARSKENRRIDSLIRIEFDRSKQRSGSPKITKVLQQNGEKIHRTRVAKRMRKMDLRSKTKKKFRVTTDSKHSEPVAPNLLNRVFTVSGKAKSHRRTQAA